MSAVLLLHYSPLEYYPPVMNFLDQIKKWPGADKKWIVISTAAGDSVERFTSSDPRIRIFRFGSSGRHLSRLGRVIVYVWFYIMSSLTIVWFKPRSIFYYETLSSLPVFLSRRYFFMKIPFYIHYHEYISPEEHRASSTWFKWLRRRERNILPFASWISHTNSYRLDLFLREEGISGFPEAHVLPNYPPAEWAAGLSNHPMKFPIRVVYAGALSLDTMYIREFADWVIQQRGNVVWDIYSLRPDEAAVSYLSGLQSDLIRICRPVSYQQMPEMLRRYDVGIILYKGHIPNFVWNVPNKLFEYHLNGLDVWFPAVMQGCNAVAATGSYPKILSLDFDDLSRFSLDDAICRQGHVFQIHPWFNDRAYADLLQRFG